MNSDNLPTVTMLGYTCRAFTTPNESQCVTITGEWQALGITETVPADIQQVPTSMRLTSCLFHCHFIWWQLEYDSFKLSSSSQKTKLDHYHDQQESAGSCLPYTMLLLVSLFLFYLTSYHWCLLIWFTLASCHLHYSWFWPELSVGHLMVHWCIQAAVW